MQEEQLKREEEEAKRKAEWEEEMRRRKEEYEREQARQAEEAERIRQAREQKEENERLEAERRLREENFKKNLEEELFQQETKVIDPDGNRWFRCEYCGKIAKVDEFSSYGGTGKINLGKCYACAKEQFEQLKAEMREKASHHNSETRKNLCPYCRVELVKKQGSYGLFWGCPNYPACRFKRKI